MIEELKKRFVLVNMTVIGCILLIVSVCSCVLFHHYLTNRLAAHVETSFHTKQTLWKEKHSIITSTAKKTYARSVYTFTYDLKEHAVIEISSGDPSLGLLDTDIIEEFLATLPVNTVSYDKENDIYLMYDNNGKSAVFTIGNMNNVRDTISSLRQAVSTIYLLTMILLLLINLQLAKWVVTPIQRMMEQQRRFIANASHELKAPLTVVLANNSILKKEKTLTEEERHWIENSHAEIIHMKELIDSMLSLAQADERPSFASCERLSFSKIVTGTALHFESAIYEHDLLLHTDIEDSIYLSGNRTQLKQLVIILLDNAMKHSSPGGEIFIQLRKNHFKGCSLLVRNTTGYISEENLPFIFQRFYRISREDGANDSSYGLGLSIAQSIALNHNGKITVESSRERGTQFLVHLDSVLKR